MVTEDENTDKKGRGRPKKGHSEDKVIELQIRGSKMYFSIIVLFFFKLGIQIKAEMLTLVLLNKLRCHAHFQFSANQIT